MKKSYAIEVDCANCANEMERAARNIPGVAEASVNFMMQKMRVVFTEGSDPQKVMQEVAKACKKIEPDCCIEF
ncbi:MAG: heavy-metal-associated domain-containing protein [Clostridiales bacterium]|nr:heavy-metal-associated domain-containing protein [Clostridiales bacterium]MDD7431974.1 heavy metal-associated domain-containing protein [Clostridiales bacterium]MDY3060959.1 heavy metal-associated domain-containing protein [Eubacteriales bacterium]